MSDSEFSGADLTGRVVDRRFEVGEKLGEGGMGAIYHAKQLSMNRMVALKLLLRDRRGDPISAERFKHEAYLASRLRHPNAVVIYDFGQAEDGLLYIAMELLTGQNLKECMHTDAPLGHVRGSAIMLQMLRPIAQAHGMGLVHRDLKPANIFLTTVEGDPDFVKVLDFGVAKLTAVQDSVEGYQGGLTVAGKIYGTPNYMSPEQIRGKDVDQQSDLYSLGIIFYEMLCGRRPFEAETPVDVMMMHLRDAPEPPSTYEPSIPAAIDEVALKALEKEPKDRFASAEEFIDTLLTLGMGGSGAFGTLRSDRSGETSIPFGTIEAEQSNNHGVEESAITGLGFLSDDFGDDFQDEKTVLELDESIDADFSIDSLDIESEQLDRSQQDTLFQSAADKSMRELFDKIDPSVDRVRSLDDSSQLDALDVDEFELDEPSRLVPIPNAPSATLNASLNPNKATRAGYEVASIVNTLGSSSNRQGESETNSVKSGVSPFGSSGVPVMPKAGMSVRSEVPRPQGFSSTDTEPKQPAQPKRPIPSEPKGMGRRGHEEVTPEPGANDQWAAAFAGVKPAIVDSQGGRFAMPAAARTRKGFSRTFLYVLLAIGMIGMLSVAYVMFSSEDQTPASIILADASTVCEKFDVYVSEERMSAASDRLTVNINDLSEKEVMVLSKDGKQQWGFSLPVIEESTELLLLLDSAKAETARLRVNGTTIDSVLKIDGLVVAEPWVVVVGTPGRELALERIVNGTPSSQKVILKGGEALQILEF